MLRLLLRALGGIELSLLSHASALRGLQLLILWVELLLLLCLLGWVLLSCRSSCCLLLLLWPLILGRSLLGRAKSLLLLLLLSSTTRFHDLRLKHGHLLGRMTGHCHEGLLQFEVFSVLLLNLLLHLPF